MSDLEQELAGVLAGVAERAPGAVGLADAARRRHRGRRQRRLAVGGAVVALVVGFGAALVGGLGDDRAVDPVDDPAPEGWQTISQDDVRAEVPADWRQVTCGEGEVPRWSPPSEDPCGEWRGAAFFGSALYDSMVGPGVLADGEDGRSSGYVTAGDLVLSVGAVDRDLARRILATARVDGQPVVDGSTWVSFDRGALSYEVPAWWGLGEDADRSGYSVCAVPAKGQEAPAPEQVDASHVVVRQVVGDRMVTASAPTQAVAELVLATVEVDGRARSDAPCAPEDFSVGLLPGESTPGAGTAEASGVPALAEVENDGVSFSILDGWREKSCGGLVQYTPGPACRSIQQSEGIQFLDASSFEPAMDEGVLRPGGSSARRLWAGYVLRGRWAVLVVHPDKETAQTLLGLVR